MHHALYIDIDSYLVCTSIHIESRDGDTRILSDQIALYDNHQRPAHHARTTDSIRSEALVHRNDHVHHSKHALYRDQYDLCLYGKFSIAYGNGKMVCDSIFCHGTRYQKIREMDKKILHKNHQSLRPAYVWGRFFWLKQRKKIG